VDSDAIQSDINQWGFAEQGFNYYVVAILGCQSSGKSKSYFQQISSYDATILLTSQSLIIFETSRHVVE